MSDRRRPGPQAGFTLLELIIAVTVVLIISSVVTSSMIRATHAQQTIWNRTELHSGVRSATELLQQEVGQAGRVTVPQAITLANPIAVGDSTGIATLSSVNGLFLGELVQVGGGATGETMRITDINTGAKQITAQHVYATGVTVNAFQSEHLAGESVVPAGGFGTGVVPPSTVYTHGSTGSVLKLYGDVNGDSNMVYVEYTCDTTNHKLYRNMMPWNATTKPPLGADKILLDNVYPNPAQVSGGQPLPCFQYQLDLSNGYVLDVAVTLTVQTQRADTVTKQFQTETKALLNVSPRNVIGTWQAAGGNINRVQPMPASVTTLLGT
jgi:prepilin-type N-terminal cleavage/methylation domain-containing protein